MTVDLDKLEALARAASNIHRGPWYATQAAEQPVSDEIEWAVTTDYGEDDEFVCVRDRTEQSGPSATRKLAQHIAATSPDVVLALISELRTARPIVEAAREFTRRSVEGYGDGDLNELRWSVDAAAVDRMVPVPITLGAAGETCIACGRAIAADALVTSWEEGYKHEVCPEKSIAELIARSSIGAAVDDVKERGIDAHLADPRTKP